MELNKSSETMVSEVKFGRSRLSREKAITIFLLAVGLLFLIVGIALMAVAATDKKSDEKNGSSSKQGGEDEAITTIHPTTTDPSTTKAPSPSGRCDFSEEAQKVGLAEFLGRVKETYYKLHPYEVYTDPDVTTDRVKTEYVAYDPTPSVIKIRTDTALTLLKEISDKEVDTDKLKLREKKALAQVKHYLQHMFGQPYDVNYYAGDWMMGPNLYCKQQICYHGNAVYNGIGLHHKPHNADDVKLIESKLKTHKKGIFQYIENMKMGVRRGMIRSEEECQAGIDSIIWRYLNTYLYKETGVLKEWFVQPILDSAFYSGITEAVNDEWKNTHNGKDVNETIRDYLVTYLGEPITKLLSYLEMEHTYHCVPSNVSSGLSTLPLKYVWYNGTKNTSWPTNPTLPTGEPLNGSEAYLKILSYFTTNKMTPSEVYKLGKEQLNKFYPMIVAVAKEVTGESDTATAVMKFRQKLNSSENYFNDEPIPKNESDKVARKKCSDVEGAKKYCPNRWAAMQLWFAESRRVMSLLEPKTVPMFYFTGENATTPTCPVEMQADLNPWRGFQSYTPSDKDCTKSATFNVPFFKDDIGPKFEEFGANSHLLRPGHHTQQQGNIEHFKDCCGGVIGWLDGVTSYTAFTEGWASYAEEYILEETDVYRNEPMQTYGMLKWEVVRAIRLIIDPGLHSSGLKRYKAIEIFRNYTWDDTDQAEKEVTRYQSTPGRQCAYMIGQLMIKKAREYAKKELGEKFSMRDFHYQVLAQGSSPMAYLDDHVKKYVSCVKNKAEEGCDVILNSPKKTHEKK